MVKKWILDILKDLEFVGILKIKGDQVELRKDFPIVLIQCVENYLQELYRNYVSGKITKQAILNKLRRTTCENLLLEAFDICLMDMINYRRAMLGIRDFTFTTKYLEKLYKVKKGILDTVLEQEPKLYDKIIKTISILKEYYLNLIKSFT